MVGFVVIRSRCSCENVVALIPTFGKSSVGGGLEGGVRKRLAHVFSAGYFLILALQSGKKPTKLPSVGLEIE
jgi:hypothetical protein